MLKDRDQQPDDLVAVEKLEDGDKGEEGLDRPVVRPRQRWRVTAMRFDSRCHPK